jgi:hypothetical protein
MTECVASGAEGTVRIVVVVLMGMGTGLKKGVTVGDALRVDVPSMSALTWCVSMKEDVQVA